MRFFYSSFLCQVIEGETADLQYFTPENMPKLAMAYPDWVFKRDCVVNTYFEWNREWLTNLA